MLSKVGFILALKGLEFLTKTAFFLFLPGLIGLSDFAAIAGQIGVLLSFSGAIVFGSELMVFNERSIGRISRIETRRRLVFEVKRIIYFISIVLGVCLILSYFLDEPILTIPQLCFFLFASLGISNLSVILWALRAEGYISIFQVFTGNLFFASIIIFTLFCLTFGFSFDFYIFCFTYGCLTGFASIILFVKFYSYKIDTQPNSSFSFSWRLYFPFFSQVMATHLLHWVPVVFFGSFLGGSSGGQLATSYKIGLQIFFISSVLNVALGKDIAYAIKSRNWISFKKLMRTYRIICVMAFISFFVIFLLIGSFASEFFSIDELFVPYVEFYFLLIGIAIFYSPSALVVNLLDEPARVALLFVIFFTALNCGIIFIATFMPAEIYFLGFSGLSIVGCYLSMHWTMKKKLRSLP